MACVVQCSCPSRPVRVRKAHDASLLTLLHARRPQLVKALQLLYQDVEPLTVATADMAAVYAAAPEAARAQGWRITAEAAPSRLQALVVTR
jgi:hypothetical protein